MKKIKPFLSQLYGKLMEIGTNTNRAFTSTTQGLEKGREAENNILFSREEYNEIVKRKTSRMNNKIIRWVDE